MIFYKEKQYYTKNCFYCGTEIKIGVDKFCHGCGCEALQSYRDMGIKAVQDYKNDIQNKIDKTKKKKNARRKKSR